MAKSSEKQTSFETFLLLFFCRQAKKINKVEIARQIKAGGKEKKTFSTLPPSGDSEINEKKHFRIFRSIDIEPRKHSSLLFSFPPSLSDELLLGQESSMYTLAYRNISKYQRVEVSSFKKNYMFACTTQQQRDCVFAHLSMYR